MFNQVRRHLSSYISLAIGALVFLALIVLSTNIASAAPVSDHLEVCSVNVFNGITRVSNSIDLGSEVDARLKSELDAARCAVAELEQEYDHVMDLFLPQESLQEVSQGLDQDLRLSEELFAALEVVSSFDARITSEGRAAWQFALQESRDANLDPELTFDYDFGADQDFRLAAELSASREAVVSLNSR